METDDTSMMQDIKCTYTEFESIHIHKLRFWSLWMWIQFPIEHIFVMIYLHTWVSQEEFIAALIVNYCVLWLFVWSFYVLYAFYFVNVERRGRKYKAKKPLYINVAIQVFNLIFCIFWGIKNPVDFHSFWGNEYLLETICYWIGLVLVYSTYFILGRMMYIEYQLWKYWRN